MFRLSNVALLFCLHMTVLFYGETRAFYYKPRDLLPSQKQHNTGASVANSGIAELPFPTDGFLGPDYFDHIFSAQPLGERPPGSRAIPTAAVAPKSEPDLNKTSSEYSVVASGDHEKAFADFRTVWQRTLQRKKGVTAAKAGLRNGNGTISIGYSYTGEKSNANDNSTISTGTGTDVKLLNMVMPAHQYEKVGQLLNKLRVSKPPTRRFRLRKATTFLARKSI